VQRFDIAAAGGGGGWGRRAAGRGGRVAQAQLKRENAGLVTDDLIAAEEDDDDPARLALVETWEKPPPPLSFAAMGVQFPEGYRSRAHWVVGTAVDMDLRDGRGWSRARIVNIVAAPRSGFLCFDVTFEAERVDVAPGAIFRVGVTSTGLAAVAEHAEPRFVARGDEQRRYKARVDAVAKATKKGGAEAAGAAVKDWRPADFHRTQLVDVAVGSRWFLGCVTQNRFIKTGRNEAGEDVLQDVVDVQLLDFHSDSSRRFTKDSLHRTHPVAFSHTLTHYPLAALPSIRDKDLVITEVYASRLPGFGWTTEGRPAGADEEDEDPARAAAAAAQAADNSIDRLLAEDGPNALRAAGEAAAANGAAGAAAAAAAAAPAAAAAATPVPDWQPTRPLGRFRFNVVSDVEFPARLPDKPVELLDRRTRLLERSFPLLPEDGMVGRGDGAIGEELTLRRLKATLANIAGVAVVNVELDVQPLLIGRTGELAPTAVALRRFNRQAPDTAAQRTLEGKYRAWIDGHLNNKQMALLPNMEFRAARLRQITQRLADIRKHKGAARDRAMAVGDAYDSNEDAPPPMPAAPKRRPPAAAAASPFGRRRNLYNSDEDTDGTDGGSSGMDVDTAAMPGMADLFAKENEKQAAAHAKRLKSAGVPHDGQLRWYTIEARFHLSRSDAKMPKKTSEMTAQINELMLLLFPESAELARASAAAVAPMPAYLPASLTLDGLLLHSATYHHNSADAEALVEEEQKKRGDAANALDDEEEEKAVVPASAAAAAAVGWGEPAAPAAADPLKLSQDALSRAAGLIPALTLKDYQCQTVRWMLRAESEGHNVSQPFWTELRMEDGCRFYYSPCLQRFCFTPLPDVRGGFVSEEMGLGKTIEALALVNLQAQADYDSAKREAEAALAANPAGDKSPRGKKRRASGAAAAAAAANTIPVVRDAHGAFPTRATLIICPVSLISQWVAELKEKSARPLKVLSYHGKRPQDPRDLLDYDVVLTAYSILSVESSQIAARSRAAALNAPWAFEGPQGLSYTSPLSQVHWRRVILDEGHSVKNASAECSQQANKLLARCRWLMSGTPFGTSLMDTRGQCRFLGMVGLTGSYLYTELDRFMLSQARYASLLNKVREDDWEGVPYRTMEWIKRFRNIFTTLMTQSMMRHVKGMLFRGRENLLVLPDARVDVRRVQLSPTQRAAYKLLFEFASKRFKQFKDAGDAVSRTIEVLQLLVPLRQACSVDTVDIDALKQQLRDIARGIAVGGRVMGAAAMPSDGFPQAEEPAFGTLADECSVCLELLEDAVQTACRHLFCKECIVALCESKGAEAGCPQCRASVSPANLFAPLVLPTKEELERQAKEDEQRKAPEEAEAKQRAEAGEDDEKMNGAEDPPATSAVAASAAAAAAAVPIRPPARKRARLSDGEERKGDDEDEDAEFGEDGEAAGGGADAVASDGAAAGADGEVDPESLSGSIEFDAKLTALLDELREMKTKDPTAKALIFTQFRNSMDKIHKALQDAGLKHEMLLGHYTLPQRKKALENFKSDPDTVAFLLSVRAAAAGLTLTAASYVMIIEPGFNPAVMLQAINRVWRIGQAKQVEVRYFACADTIEETILAIAREKMSKNKSGGDEENSGSNLQLLPDIKDPSVKAAADAAAAAAAAGGSSSSSDDEDLPLGRRGFGARGGGRRERGGRGVTMGHATNDAMPDLRLGELERLFAV